ncbi:hypothetical protein EYF80_012109 [Liparis tanakae]|uniref:Uncharacterized protein n=1 Tax=Liparis tanakae TaxID=230148 RepID=A0A4Z2IJ74_9TELE|nr:hypothetical protein EYF80_012109 [Liparis tanakae]
MVRQRRPGSEERVIRAPLVMEDRLLPSLSGFSNQLKDSQSSRHLPPGPGLLSPWPSLLPPRPGLLPPWPNLLPPGPGLLPPRPGQIQPHLTNKKSGEKTHDFTPETADEALEDEEDEEDEEEEEEEDEDDEEDEDENEDDPEARNPEPLGDTKKTSCSPRRDPQRHRGCTGRTTAGDRI